MSRRHLVMLLALSAIWGASFMFIKIGVRELEPTTLVCVRLGIGALTLLPLALVRLGGRQTVRQLRAAGGPLVATGLVNSAVPIVAISWAEKHIDSGLTAVIQASAPLFTALLALRFSRSERVSGVRLAGTGIAYVLYYALLAGAGASRSILVTYLVPALALGYGAVFLGEPVTAPAIGGLLLVLAGVALGTGAVRFARRRQPGLASDG